VPIKPLARLILLWEAGQVIDHVSIQVRDVPASATFYDAVLAPLGGKRILEYHPSYFGAFVRDPDGNNVEAVCHRPE
jgi:catechol 2,3-dioxygenase-like lactoylglutathione lyase family enzyme